MNGIYMSLTGPSARFPNTNMQKRKITAHQDQRRDKLSKSDPTNLYRHRAVSNLSNGHLISDDEDGTHVTADEFETNSDRADSASNLSSDPLHENIAKLRDDYANLLREVENLRETYKDSLSQFTSSLEKQREYFVAALQDTSLRIRQIDDRVDDKLDQFHYSSDERVKEIEERLDDYKYKMTRFEELQEQRRMEHPLGDSDIASRGREVMSSVISLGLAMVSLLLFVFTTVVDCLKVFSENNALSTCLSLGLFGLIIAMYYYFGLGGRTV